MLTRIALLLVLAGTIKAAPRVAAQSTAPVKELNTLIEGVDRTFASMKDFSARFFQKSTNSVNQTPLDEGLLYLAKGKKMRLDYEKPEAKQWISDGKTLYTYIPGNRQANMEQVKDSTGEQIPLMFLVGRSGLRNEFHDFRDLTGVKPFYEGNRVIQMIPKRKNQDIDQIEIEVNPQNYLIERMVIVFSDKAKTEFVFKDIKINSGIPDSKFKFIPPPGIRVQGTTNQ